MICNTGSPLDRSFYINYHVGKINRTPNYEMTSLVQLVMMTKHIRKLIMTSSKIFMTQKAISKLFLWI